MKNTKAYTFLKKITDFANQFGMFPPNSLIIVAVSGGADSMSLLDALSVLSKECNFDIAAAHFNHKLRADESDADELFVINECRLRNIKLINDSADVASYAKMEKMGKVEAARECRYEFLHKTAEQLYLSGEYEYVYVATAHNADDLAETVLINLTRGAGISGLSGIPPVRDNIIRPMLHISRDEIMEYIGARGIKYVEDSSNKLENQVRNKIRHTVIPILREINPSFTHSVAKAAELSRRDEEFLTSKAIEHLDSDSLSVEQINNLPFSIASRIIKQFAPNSLSYKHIEAILNLCAGEKTSGYIKVPGAVVRREYDKLFIEKVHHQCKEFGPIHIKDGDEIFVPQSNLTISCKLLTFDEKKSAVFNETFTTFLFHVDKICGKMTVGSRREGDSIKFVGSGYTKKLKKLFIEKRIPATLRAMIPIISDDQGVLAVYGFGMSGRAVPSHGQHALQIEFRGTHLL